jgi:hypothetical protein
MADGVDATMNRMQPPALNAPLYRPTAEAQPRELRALHHAVLSVGERRNRRVLIASVKFPIYAMGNFTLAGHAPILARRMCRGARGM